MYDEGYGINSSTFEQSYRCYPVPSIEKSHLENGNKIIMPPSALDCLAYLQIDYPMVFKLSNPSAGKITHCGVLEFTADEGLIYLPHWMMENMVLQEGDIVHISNASLSKGTYVKLQPHTKDFIELANPKAILETTFRNYSCLTTGDTIMVAYNKKRYYINIVETKPSFGISIIETDCEVDFATPLDYKEPEKPARSTLSKKTPPEVQEEEPAKKITKVSPFTGSARRLDGKASVESGPEVSSPMLKQHQSKATNGGNGSASSSSCQRFGKRIFGSNSDQPPNGKPKATSKESSPELSQKKEDPKFQAFTGKKYSLKD